MTTERALILSQIDTILARGRYGSRTVDVQALKAWRAIIAEDGELHDQIARIVRPSNGIPSEAYPRHEAEE